MLLCTTQGKGRRAKFIPKSQLVWIMAIDYQFFFPNIFLSNKGNKGEIVLENLFFLKKEKSMCFSSG